MKKMPPTEYYMRGLKFKESRPKNDVKQWSWNVVTLTARRLAISA
jgi:hypothetical protein